MTHASVLDWLDKFDPEEDGQVDVERLTEETDELIGGWNAFGRELCGRFLAVAEAGTPANSSGRGATTRATSPHS